MHNCETKPVKVKNQQIINTTLYKISELNESEMTHRFKYKVKFNTNVTLSKSSCRMIM